MYTEDTYDPEADYQAQINNRELEKKRSKALTKESNEKPTTEE